MSSGHCGKDVPGVKISRLCVLLFGPVFWPEIDTPEAARKTAKQASVACFVVAGLTALLAALSAFGIQIITLPISALVDATAFAVLGVGIRKMWRGAAIIGLVLYVCEAVWSIRKYGGAGSNAMYLIFILMFVSGVRATFAYPKLLGQERAPWSAWFWPKMDSTDAARKAAKKAAGLCFFTAGYTAVIVVLSEFGIRVPIGVDIWDLVYATYFALVGIGIWKMWRSATIAGFALYLLAVVGLHSEWSQTQHRSEASYLLVIIMTIFMLAFVGAIRATFAYPKLVRQERPISSRVATAETTLAQTLEIGAGPGDTSRVLCSGCQQTFLTTALDRCPACRADWVKTPPMRVS